MALKHKTEEIGLHAVVFMNLLFRGAKKRNEEETQAPSQSNPKNLNYKHIEISK